jgi:hypothetical protein
MRKLVSLCIEYWLEGLYISLLYAKVVDYFTLGALDFVWESAKPEPKPCTKGQDLLLGKSTGLRVLGSSN